MHKIKHKTLAIAASGAALIANPVSVLAAPVDPEVVGGNTKNNLITSDDKSSDDVVQRIITFLIQAAVAFAIIMLIVGGIRYVISAGNQEKVTAAKNTIMYALIGLIIALLAGFIVNFVFKEVLNSDDPATGTGDA